MRIKEITKSKNRKPLPFLEDVTMLRDERSFAILREGKWIDGRFDRNIRIDQPTHGVGQTHAHILGRKGQELGVVNFDGTGSHGTRMRLHSKDAEALRSAGANIPKDNIIEWIALEEAPQMLLG